jgi:hypothetical protein
MDWKANAALIQDCVNALVKVKPLLEEAVVVVRNMEKISNQIYDVHERASEAFRKDTKEAKQHLRSVLSDAAAIPRLVEKFESELARLQHLGKQDVTTEKEEASLSPAKTLRSGKTIVLSNNKRKAEELSFTTKEEVSMQDSGKETNSEIKGERENKKITVTDGVPSFTVEEPNTDDASKASFPKWHETTDNDSSSNTESEVEEGGSANEEESSNNDPPEMVKIPFEYTTRGAYLQSLEENEKRRLDELASAMRTNPGIGTNDPKLIVHVNMQEKDNLYFVCYRLKGLQEKTIQLVQADQYERWGNMKQIRESVDITNGEWYCTILQCYYQDEELPTEVSRWRYQTHAYNKKSRRMRKGYYSFDNRFVRSKVPKDDTLLDWSEKVSLLNDGAFVFGPFDWKDSDEFCIGLDTWKAALPLLLEKNNIWYVILEGVL